MKKFVIVLNDPPYGTERSYNGLRLAGALGKDTQDQVRVFLIGDGSSCAHAQQRVPQGHYNIELMLKTVLRHGGEVGVCSSCMDARGMTDAELVEGTRRSSLDELTRWTREADQVLVF